MTRDRARSVNSTRRSCPALRIVRILPFASTSSMRPGANLSATGPGTRKYRKAIGTNARNPIETPTNARAVPLGPPPTTAMMEPTVHTIARPASSRLKGLVRPAYLF
jgi:hypothetical protein